MGFWIAETFNRIGQVAPIVQEWTTSLWNAFQHLQAQLCRGDAMWTSVKSIVIVVQVSDAVAVQGTSKRVFCNFDGCYSKRDGGRSDAGGLPEFTDPVGLLLRRLHDATQRTARPDHVLTQTSAENLETDGMSQAAINEQRRNPWMNRPPTCCSRAALAKILR